MSTGQTEHLDVEAAAADGRAEERDTPVESTPTWQLQTRWELQRFDATDEVEVEDTRHDSTVAGRHWALGTDVTGVVPLPTETSCAEPDSRAEHDPDTLADIDIGEQDTFLQHLPHGAMGDDTGFEIEMAEPCRVGEHYLREAGDALFRERNLASSCEKLSQIEVLGGHQAALLLDELEAGATSSTALLAALVGLCQRVGDRERKARLLGIAANGPMPEKATSECIAALASEAQRALDLPQAERHLLRLLEMQPKRWSAREELAKVCLAQGCATLAMKHYESLLESMAPRDMRAKAALRAGGLCVEEWGEEERARFFFGRAIELDPTLDRAAVSLGELLAAHGQWDELEELLACRAEELASSAVDGPGEAQDDRNALLELAARAAFERGDVDGAVRRFEALSSQSPRSLWGLGRCLLLKERPRAARDLLLLAESRMGRHRASDEDMVELAFSIAECDRATGRPGEARERYTRCAERGHARSRERLLALLEEDGQLETAFSYRRRWLRSDRAMSDEERYRQLVALSTYSADRLSQIDDAIELCKEAMSLCPESIEAERRLADLFIQGERWGGAIDARITLAGKVEDASQKATYLHSAAMLALVHDREELGLGLCEEVIALLCARPGWSGTPGAQLVESCFRKLVAAARKEGRWDDLALLYRKMIDRVPAKDRALKTLWGELAQVYREHLDESKQAIEAMEMALALGASGDAGTTLELLALYEAAGHEYLDKAIALRHELLRAEPLRVEHYRALLRLYLRAKKRDRAWCMCRALVSLRVADDKETAFFRSYERTDIHWPHQPLSAEQLGAMCNRGLDKRVTRIFGYLGELIALELASTPGRAESRDECSSEFDFLQQLFVATSFALGGSQVRLVVRPQHEGPPLLINQRRELELHPIIVMGPSSYKNRSIQEIVHSMARMLFFIRPAFILRQVLPSAEDLAAVFYGAVRLVRPDAIIPATGGAGAEHYCNIIRSKLNPDWSMALREEVDAFLESGASLDAEAWMAATDSSARNLALLLTGDLSISLSQLPDDTIFMGHGERRTSRDLVEHSVSLEHLALREELGIRNVDDD